MWTPLSWAKQWMSSLGQGADAPMMQLFTPQVAQTRQPAIRLAVAGLTVGGLAVAGVVALTAMGTLFLALGIIYFLVTEVLGIRLDFDPRAFVAQAQKYAAQSN